MEGKRSFFLQWVRVWALDHIERALGKDSRRPVDIPASAQAVIFGSIVHLKTILDTRHASPVGRGDSNRTVYRLLGASHAIRGDRNVQRFDNYFANTNGVVLPGPPM